MMPMLSRLEALGAQVLSSILQEFLGGADRSRFAFMNVVTARARDTRDPEARWTLEEIGGAIPFEAEQTQVSKRQRVLTA